MNPFYGGSDSGAYDGRRQEPPYTTDAEDKLSEAVEMLRKVSAEYRRMALAFDPGDSRRTRCDELSDEVIGLLVRLE